MKYQNSFPLFFATTIITFFLFGCSITGWTTKEIPSESGLASGNRISITTYNGDIIDGEFTGTDQLAIADYRKIYNTFISSSLLEEVLPEFGENIKITTKLSDEKVWEGKFISFDSKNISLLLKGMLEPSEFYLSGLTSLSKFDGKPLYKLQFRGFFENGKIPLRSAIVVKNGNGEMKIPINDIKKINSQSTNVAEILTMLER
ncbi:MAG: hypothetical protein HY964_02425 [Ignavibacteriales bacterium]|nr:hypothetical protein [Ignavibacteriales bacterium]